MKRCDKCYMDPCICGKMYEKLSSSQLFNLIKSLKDVLDKRHVPGIDIKISGGDIVDQDTSITLEGVLKKANLTNEKLLQYSKYFADAKDMFDDIFERFASYVKLEKVKTTNLGSMFEVTYALELKEAGLEKEMIDEIRTRNGNLTITCGTPSHSTEELQGMSS